MNILLFTLHSNFIDAIFVLSFSRKSKEQFIYRFLIQNIKRNLENSYVSRNFQTWSKVDIIVTVLLHRYSLSRNNFNFHKKKRRKKITSGSNKRSIKITKMLNLTQHQSELIVDCTTYILEIHSLTISIMLGKFSSHTVERKDLETIRYE